MRELTSEEERILDRALRRSTKPVQSRGPFTEHEHDSQTYLLRNSSLRPFRRRHIALQRIDPLTLRFRYRVVTPGQEYAIERWGQFEEVQRMGVLRWARYQLRFCQSEMARALLRDAISSWTSRQWVGQTVLGSRKIPS